MSPRTFVTRGASLLAIAAFGLAACESKTVVQPNVFPLQITVSPSSATLTAAGQKVQFVALVSGGETGQATQGVNWSSSNTAVATVDANGIVTAVANGTSSIIATSKAVGTVQAAGIVTVTIATTPPPPVVAPPTVSIQSITDNAGNNVDVTNAAGQINVALNVDVPTGNNISSVNVQVDGTTACSQSFTQGTQAGVGTEAANAVVIVCPIVTNKVSAAGVPVYANGPHTITATLVAPGGTVKASTSQSITFNNTSALILSAAGATTATDAAGLLWNGGKLTVTVTPSVFTSQTLQTVTVTVNDPVNALTSTKTVTATGNTALTVSFPSDSAAGGSTNGMQGFEAANTTVSVSGITTAGQNFAGATPSITLRYDDKAPAVGATALQFPAVPWVGAGFNFASASSKFPQTGAKIVNQAASDAGVDKVTYTVQVSPNASTKSYAAATTSDALGESVTNTAFVARVQVCDALNNCTNVYAPGTSGTPVTFGVDVTAPTLTVPNGQPANNTAVGTGTSLAFTFTDNLAGFSATQLLVKVDTITAKGRGCFYGVAPSSPGPCTAGVLMAAGTVILNSPRDAYYDVTVQSEDQAGNMSAVNNRVLLVDATAPTVGTIGLPPSFTGGANTTFSTTASDNLDLNGSQLFERFVVGAITVDLPFNQPSSLGTFGYTTLTTSANVSETVPFVKSLYFNGTDASNTANAVAPTHLLFRVTDQAGNVTGSTPTPLINLPAFGAIAGVNSGSTFAVTSPSAAKNICDGTGDCSGTDGTSIGLTAKITGQSGTFANPFAAVYFYYYDNASVIHLIGVSAAPTVTDLGSGTTGRTWSYTTTFTPAGLAAQAGVPIFAVGVDAQGDAWMTGMNTNVSIVPGA